MTTNQAPREMTDTERRFAQLEVDDLPEAPVHSTESAARFAQIEIDLPAAPTPASTPAGAAAAIEASVAAPTPRASQNTSAPAFERGLRPQGEASPVAAIQGMVDQLVAVEQADARTGGIVFWALNGVLEVSRLVEAWQAEGLNAEWLLPVPSPVVAIRRAVAAQVTRGQFTTEHPDGGWVLVEEKKDDHALDYQIGIRFRLAALPAGADEDTEPTIEMLDVPAHVTPEAAQALHEAVCAEFAKLRRGEVSSVDVSSWLTKLLDRHLSAVALRDSGGFYFVPRGNVETWDKIKRALTSCTSFKLYTVPAMHSIDTVAAVLDGLRRDSSEALAEMENELEMKTLGGRGNANRLKALDVLKAKVAGFEKLLGVKLTETTARIDTLKTRIQAATTRTETLIID